MDKNKRNYKGIKADERQLKKAFVYRHLTSSIPKLELKQTRLTEEWTYYSHSSMSLILYQQIAYAPLTCIFMVDSFPSRFTFRI